MVKNPRAKGNRRERQAEKILEEQGYATAKKDNSRFGASDFFNMFDIVAVKPGERVRFIQVKSNNPPNLGEFKNDSLRLVPEDHCTVEVWVCYDRKGWKVYDLDFGEEEWCVVADGRGNNEKMGEALKTV